MSAAVCDWVQQKFGVDVTGKAELEREQKMEWVRRELGSKERFAAHRVSELKLELAQLMSIKAQWKKGKESNDAVVVTSDKLYFPLPLDKYIMNTVVARNLSEVPVSFKMKATDPTRYTVKPRHGVIAPFSLVEISVTLKPTTADPTHLHDKFLLECRHVHPALTCPSCGYYATSTSTTANNNNNNNNTDPVENNPTETDPVDTHVAVACDDPNGSRQQPVSSLSSFQHSHGSCCNIRIKCKFTSLLPVNFQLRRVSNGQMVGVPPTSTSLNAAAAPPPLPQPQPPRNSSVPATTAFTATRVNSNSSVSYPPAAAPPPPPVVGRGGGYQAKLK